MSITTVSVLLRSPLHSCQQPLIPVITLDLVPAQTYCSGLQLVWEALSPKHAGFVYVDRVLASQNTGQMGHVLTV